MSGVFKTAYTAVITGGASGIGLALAKKCAGYGMKVLVADLNEKHLEMLPTGITPYKLDVSRAEDWAGLRAAVDSNLGGKINLLALNAGMGGPNSFDAGTLDMWHKIIDVNLFGVVNGSTTLLPLVRSTAEAGEEAAVVITGSKQGITNPPGNPAYNASKAAVKSVAEQISFDLRETKIGVHLLVPGWTFTGLAGGNHPGSGKEKPNGAWWPEQVADYLEKKMGEGQFWVLCPDDDVTEDMDQKRMLWAAGDAVYGRKPLSRWREEYKGDVAEWMKKDI